MKQFFKSRGAAALKHTQNSHPLVFMVGKREQEKIFHM